MNITMDYALSLPHFDILIFMKSLFFIFMALKAVEVLVFEIRKENRENTPLCQTLSPKEAPHSKAQSLPDLLSASTDPRDEPKNEAESETETSIGEATAQQDQEVPKMIPSVARPNPIFVQVEPAFIPFNTRRGPDSRRHRSDRMTAAFQTPLVEILC